MTLTTPGQLSDPTPPTQTAATADATDAPPARVLHVISGLELENGGPVTALLGLVEAQAARGTPVTVLSSWQRPEALPVAERLRKKGIETIMVGPAKGRLNRHPDLAGAIARAVEQADVVMIHALWEDAQHLAAVACRRAGVPYVISTCGMLDPWPLAQKKWLKRAFLALRVRRDLRGARALHAATPAEGENLRRHDLTEVVVELLGVELDDFRDLPPRGRFRAKHPETVGERPMVLFLSRLNYKKGLDLLIPGFARAVNDMKGTPGGEAVLVLAGPVDAGYDAELRRIADAAGVADRVMFAGMLRGRERVEAFVDADLFALTSYAENFGIVVAEAMASAIPLVVSDQVATHTEVGAADAGSVVPTDVPAIAGALQKWLADPEAGRVAGARGRAHALEVFDWDRNARHWDERFAEYAREARQGATR